MEILESNGIAWPNPHMWKTPHLSPSVALPTCHPEDGSDSHSHSPRRRALMRSSGSQGAGMPCSSTQFNAAFMQTLPILQRSAMSSGSSYPDPITEPAAYKEWLTSLGLANVHVPPIDASVLWPRNSHASRQQTSTDTSMPDYLSAESQTISIDPMQMAANLDDDADSQVPTVPSNTPIVAPDLTSHSSGQFHSLIFTATVGSLPSKLTPAPRTVDELHDASCSSVCWSRYNTDTVSSQPTASTPDSTSSDPIASL